MYRVVDGVKRLLEVHHDHATVFVHLIFVAVGQMEKACVSGVVCSESGLKLVHKVRWYQ